MSEELPKTLDQFYKFVSEKKLMALQCLDCGKIYLPPTPRCPKCFSFNTSWKELSGKGKLLTYTEIHVATPQFASQAPYLVGIVELEENVRLPGIIKNCRREELAIGKPMKVVFEEKAEERKSWPAWGRYYLVPA